MLQSFIFQEQGISTNSTGLTYCNIYFRVVVLTKSYHCYCYLVCGGHLHLQPYSREHQLHHSPLLTYYRVNQTLSYYFINYSSLPSVLRIAINTPASIILENYTKERKKVKERRIKQQTSRSFVRNSFLINKFI